MTTSGTNVTFRTFTFTRSHFHNLPDVRICRPSRILHRGEWSDKCQFLKGVKRILHLARLHCRWQRESLPTAYHGSPGSSEWQLRVLQITDRFECLFLTLCFSWQLCTAWHSWWVCPTPTHLSQEIRFLTSRLHFFPASRKAPFHPPPAAPPPCVSPVSDLCQLSPHFLPSL